MIKATVVAAVTGLALGTLALTSGPVVAAPESTDPIKITLHDWTGQLITSKLMGEVLKKAGYNVSYVPADYLAQFTGLESGDLDVAMEIWATTGKEAMDKAIATGKVVNFGETGMLAKEEWWYPSYVKEKCPGLPDWKALNACAEIFAVPETAPKGRYLGGPVTWGGFDEERVAGLGLDFEVVHAGTDANLFAELDSAISRKEPIVLWIYAPHWAPIKYDGEWVEFPAYSPECYASGKYDCGKPSGPIWKVGWVGVEKKWPGAAKAIRAFKIDNAAMGKLISAVDLDGKSVDDVVAQWMADNEATWKAWIE
jgi:glycine betaine/proline transport system substrate-binding protein